MRPTPLAALVLLVCATGTVYAGDEPPPGPPPPAPEGAPAAPEEPAPAPPAPPPAPVKEGIDLVVESVKLVPDRIALRGKTKVQVVVRNAGAVASPATKAEAVLTEPPRPPARRGRDVAQGSVDVPGLAAGESATATIE